MNKAKVAGSGTSPDGKAALPSPLYPPLPKSLVRPVGEYAPQSLEMLLPIIVTDAASASARPHPMLAAEPKLTLCPARIFPAKAEPSPRVAELPTWK
jgi:hypothetical protein